MARIAYVNGAYAHMQDASVNIEDRGYQFSDGIYEYIAFYNRRLLDGDLHLARMERSLEALSIPAPMSMRALRLVIAELIERNGREHGGLYIQVSRGVAPRNHAYPKQARPSLVMTVCGAKTPKDIEFSAGVKVITYPENRWARRDIKSVSLLANVIAKQASASQQAREAWLYESDGAITEGAVSNAYIVSASGELVTHPADVHILGGITRDVVLGLARKSGIKVAERPFNKTEIAKAAEAFITSTSINVLPVVRIDGAPVGDGKVGKITRSLQALYNEHIFSQTGQRFA